VFCRFSAPLSFVPLSLYLSFNSPTPTASREVLLFYCYSSTGAGVPALLTSLFCGDERLSQEALGAATVELELARGELKKEQLRARNLPAGVRRSIHPEDTTAAAAALEAHGAGGAARGRGSADDRSRDALITSLCADQRKLEDQVKSQAREIEGLTLSLIRMQQDHATASMLAQRSMYSELIERAEHAERHVAMLSRVLQDAAAAAREADGACRCGFCTVVVLVPVDSRYWCELVIAPQSCCGRLKTWMVVAVVIVVRCVVMMHAQT
jgi:hypothetical protein